MFCRVFCTFLIRNYFNIRNIRNVVVVLFFLLLVAKPEARLAELSTVKQVSLVPLLFSSHVLKAGK